MVQVSSCSRTHDRELLHSEEPNRKANLRWLSGAFCKKKWRTQRLKEEIIQDRRGAKPQSKKSMASHHNDPMVVSMVVAECKIERAFIN
ncbi:hypothetical protein CR513_51507, partial [Mucuna pruriens]